MWALVEAELVILGVKVDRAGLAETVFETYPSAALAAWGFGRAKQSWPELQSPSVSSPPTNSCSGLTRSGSPRKAGAEDIGTIAASNVKSRSRENVAGSRVGPFRTPDHSR